MSEEPLKASVDLLLSSGYLAFARHVGFLRELEREPLEVEAVVGTSSGALVGALWAAGHRGEALIELLSARPPLSYLKLSVVGGGLFSLSPMIDFLREQLPERFEELPIPLAVGVVDKMSRYQLITEGSLPEAVAASCAVPYLFCPVELNGRRLRDGGVSDRVGWEAWRAWRSERQPSDALVHWVERSHGRDVSLPAEARVVSSPRSGAHLWGLGDFRAQVEESAAVTRSLFLASRGEE